MMPSAGSSGAHVDGSYGHHVWGSVDISDISSSIASSHEVSHPTGGLDRRIPREIRQHLQEVVFHSDSSSEYQRATKGGMGAGISEQKRDPPEGVTITGEPIVPGAAWSIGSRLHETGDCKPCVWNWKLCGCINGVECKFCHACADGKVKSRKKERICKLRASRKQDAQEQATGQEPGTGEAPAGQVEGSVKAKSKKKKLNSKKQGEEDPPAENEPTEVAQKFTSLSL
eukprot:TRINITY_DN30584_c0_g1_i3.p1 TRINITY_DN30584_c0_g1~~TRINITY_DN30584_c0_g1_i3.p1  ORF type:complete len:228 (+),score=32.21 TRINITY_DN30584_c0_g1_i3:185-868(+)